MQPGVPGTQPAGLSGCRQTSGLHTRKRFLSQSAVHVNTKRQTESAAYTWFWWLTAKPVNLVAMSPQSLTQLMLSTVIQSPALEIRTCSATV